MKGSLRIGFFYLILATVSCHTFGQPLNFIFRNGENGYSCFRIPAIITTSHGIVLAFAEGRRNHCGDAGEIDIVLKRSVNGGASWGPLQVVWHDGANTCGNPAPVVEYRSGRIILLATWNLGTDHERSIIDQTSKDSRRVFMLASSDDGANWTKAREITGDVKLSNWTWYATGPGSGIQIRKGRYKGRLVVGCDHMEAGSKISYSHIIFSDNGGATWQRGGTVPGGNTNECTVAELPHSRLLLNMRNYGGSRYRQVATSKDGGKNWSAMHADSTLIEPVCHGSLLQYHYPGHPGALVFSNPASQGARVHMTVRMSSNDGMTWPWQKILYSGPSAYSDLAILPGGSIGCLYEAGVTKAYEGIVFEALQPDQVKN